MAEEFDEQCIYYAKFMHTLNRPSAEALYWVFFVTVLSLLFASSWRFGRLMERIEGLQPDNPHRRRLIRRCYNTSVAAGVLSMTIAVMEVYAIMTLQFCDNEPLSSLYWATWTVLQVGSVVAILGITLHTHHMIRGHKPPPWALALGTPVLVVAGLGHYMQAKIRRGTNNALTLARSRSRSRPPSNRKPEPEPLSEAPTVRESSIDSAVRQTMRNTTDEDSGTIYGDASDKFNAKIMGYTKDGDVVIRISPELSQELVASSNSSAKVKAAPSVRFDDASLPSTPAVAYMPGRSYSTDKLDEQVAVDEVEVGKPRQGRARHRSSSSVTFKGKERETTIQEHQDRYAMPRREFGDEGDSNLSADAHMIARSNSVSSAAIASTQSPTPREMLQLPAAQFVSFSIPTRSASTGGNKAASASTAQPWAKDGE